MILSDQKTLRDITFICQSPNSTAFSSEVVDFLTSTLSNYVSSKVSFLLLLFKLSLIC